MSLLELHQPGEVPARIAGDGDADRHRRSKCQIRSSQRPVDQYPAQPAVAVGVGVDRFELRMEDGRVRYRVQAFAAVREPQQVVNQLGYLAGRGRHVRRVKMGVSADPSDAGTERSDEFRSQTAVAHQAGVPTMQRRHAERLVRLLQCHTDHFEVVGHPTGGTTDAGALRDQHGHQRFSQALDPGRGDAFVAQQESGQCLPCVRELGIRCPQRGRGPLGGAGLGLGQGEVTFAELRRSPSVDLAPVPLGGHNGARTTPIPPDHM